MKTWYFRLEFLHKMIINFDIICGLQIINFYRVQLILL